MGFSEGRVNIAEGEWCRRPPFSLPRLRGRGGEGAGRTVSPGERAPSLTLPRKRGRGIAPWNREVNRGPLSSPLRYGKQDHRAWGIAAMSTTTINTEFAAGRTASAH